MADSRIQSIEHPEAETGPAQNGPTLTAIVVYQIGTAALVRLWEVGQRGLDGGNRRFWTAMAAEPAASTSGLGSGANPL